MWSNFPLNVRKTHFGMHSLYHWLIWFSCLISQSEKQGFFLLIGPYAYVGQGEACALAWAQMPLRFKQGQGLSSLPTILLHINLYIGPQGRHFFAFVLSHLNWSQIFKMNKTTKLTTSKDNSMGSNSPMTHGEPCHSTHRHWMAYDSCKVYLAQEKGDSRGDCEARKATKTEKRQWGLCQRHVTGWLGVWSQCLQAPWL